MMWRVILIVGLAGSAGWGQTRPASSVPKETIVSREEFDALREQVAALTQKVEELRAMLAVRPEAVATPPKPDGGLTLYDVKVQEPDGSTRFASVEASGEQDAVEKILARGQQPFMVYDAEGRGHYTVRKTNPLSR